MDLEKRIESLEQELQVLRNEIQATLLDIQAHLLTNEHKELRTDAMPNEHYHPANGNAKITAFSINEDDNSIEQHSVSDKSPVLKQMNVDDINSTSHRSQAQSNTSQANAIKPNTQQQGTGSLSENELEDWAKAKLDELGLQRTRELIYLYHDTGRLDNATSQMLVRLVELYAGNAKAATKKRKDSDFPFDAVKSTSRKPKQSVKKTAKRSSTSTTAQKSATRSQASAKKAQADRQAPRPQRPAPQPARSTQHHEDDDRGLILRLIAGVQSAGIGFGKTGKYQNG